MESESRETLTTGSNRLPKTEAEKESSNSGGWQAKQEILFLRERDVASDFPPRELGVTWQNLTVEAISAEASIHENVVSQFNIPRLIQESRRKSSLRKILDSSHGCVKPGEMLLVLGRPGSGCTTLLNILANKRSGFASVAGDVFYGSMTAKEAEQYRGQIVINNEEEVFFPSLTVGQTMDFATRLKVPFTLPQGVDSPEQYRLEMRDFLLKSLDIEHTLDTKVGDAFVRGVSGGERKRVSIIECLAAKGSVFCWDNSTRGLDASTALEYAKVIRAMTDVLGLASIVTLYQAGNGIYNLFDKVLLLDGGKEIYYGPLKEARPFMEALGFICHDGANVADFLTSVTVPTERKVREELKFTFPRTAEAIRGVYEKSSGYEQMTAEYDYPKTEEARQRTDMFARAVGLEKHKSLSAKSPYSVSIAAQVWICVERQYQILWGDKATFLIKQFSTIAQALITGSLFYNAPDTSAGLLSKSGACFFALLFPTLLAMAEVTDSFTGRPVLVKHKSFGFFHPIAYCIAQIAADIPVILLSMTTFSLILYFLVGLRMTADGFFIFWAIVVATSMCMTAMFRAIGAAFATFDGASKVSGIVIAAVFMYAGYMIEKPQMHPWFVWLFWINPVAYGFDALLSNEFHHAIISCVGVNLIPSGPEYADAAAHQACSGVGGAIPGQPFVLGDNYLKSLSYDHASLWRNFGIIWAFWALFVVITIWATSRWKSLSEGGSSLVIPRENSHIVKTQAREDEEAGPKETVGQVSEKQIEADRDGTADKVMPDVAANTAIFTWKNLSYTVKTASGDRLLLDNVHGWVEPGKLTALMGSSGAGKTTLLDVLAQRKTEGMIRGSIMVDGRPLPITFQRSAGYCEQLDVHEPYATVREALEFSALLRQSRDTPRHEKLAYVDTIIDLLELQDLADTLIGQVGAGLSVEQRKRVTIGVELVSKPSLLIFLDEPTSGLDGQSAYHTVRFLRKLAATGQPVLATIHQPSAQLFAQFDRLLLLAKGGRTVYFGDIGEQASVVRQYFAKHGAPCPTDANPAEHMIDVVSGTLSQGRNWNEVWLSSPEHAAMIQELDTIIDEAASKPSGVRDDGNEFATSLWQQCRLVTQRMNVSLYRNTDYVNNKLALHVFSSMFNGFSFWMTGESVGDLQLKLFAIFNFVFVAPGVLAQLQPVFLQRRDIFETREKKSKMYSWVAFVTALIVSEIPYLVICAVIYFGCWYYTVGFGMNSARAGGTFYVMLAYEFLYTGIGQFIAAYAPNEMFAALANPLVLGILVSFCGVLVPYAQIPTFWRYWLYYLNPFSYLMGSLLTFNLWGTEIKCRENELAVFGPPNGTTCGDYLAPFLSHAPGAATHLINPQATADCKVCTFARGEDYLFTLNLKKYQDAWEHAGIVTLMVFSSYALVYALMKLRTKTSKKAE